MSEREPVTRPWRLEAERYDGRWYCWATMSRPALSPYSRDFVASKLRLGRAVRLVNRITGEIVEVSDG